MVSDALWDEHFVGRTFRRWDVPAVNRYIMVSSEEDVPQKDISQVYSIF